MDNRSVASAVTRLSSTSAADPSRAARDRRTSSVVSGSAPSSTISAKPPERASSSVARSAAIGLGGRTSTGAGRQQAPATVCRASIQAARSPPATV